MQVTPLEYAAGDQMVVQKCNRQEYCYLFHIASVLLKSVSILIICPVSQTMH
jgi:hypothetical protein